MPSREMVKEVTGQGESDRGTTGRGMTGRGVIDRGAIDRGAIDRIEVHMVADRPAVGRSVADRPTGRAAAVKGEGDHVEIATARERAERTIPPKWWMD